jgi:membrane fusion protein (multidrug efflux system)
LLTALLLVASCGGEEQARTRGPRARPVVLAEVRAMDFQETVEAIGSLRAAKEVRLSPQRSGLLEAVHFEEGEQVARGDLLFTLDTAKLQSEMESVRAELESARAAARDAKRTFNRFQELYGTGSVAEQERDRAETDWLTARAEVQRLQARVELLRERLADSEVRAPFDGRVSRRLVDPGDFVEPATDLAVLYAAHALELAFNVPETELGRIGRGQSVEVRVDAVPDRRFQGRVEYVSPGVDPSTRDMLVKAVVDDQGVLKPGVFGLARVVVDVRSGSPAIPDEALVPARGGYMVFVAEPADQGMRAHLRNVTIGLRADGFVEVRQGLDIGRQVVRRGQLGLNDGDMVEPQANATRGAGAGGQ